MWKDCTVPINFEILPKSASVTGEAIQYKDQNLIGYNEKEMQQIRRTWNRDGLSGSQSTLNPTMTVEVRWRGICC